MDFLNAINSVIWHESVLYFVLGSAVLFTIWSFFGQYRALTHGVAVIRGKYDDHDDPGAINHFQALSAALSATVGLGNIGGVAVAIALGGPGAVFWMWVIGFFGMALKMAEVTLSMLHRNTDDRDNPHGGPMWVAMKGFKELNPSLAGAGKFLGGLFCVTLLISSVTGGNMFQSWNVGNLTRDYFQIPTIVTGIVLSLVVAAVILGGIKRIGAVAGRIVPFMCLAYMMAALFVVFNFIGEVPEALRLIVTSAFSPTDAQGAFLGGTFGYALLWGMKRALFSSEVGQGSSPIAHSAARTDEPVREGIVAGLEPFIDTLVVCTLTSLVIILTGTWKRDAAATFATAPAWSDTVDSAGDRTWTLAGAELPAETTEAWHHNMGVFVIAQAGQNDDTGNRLHKLSGIVALEKGKPARVEWSGSVTSMEPPVLLSNAIYADYAGATLTAKAFDRVSDGLGQWLVTLAAWLFAISTIISWSYYGEQGIVYLLGEGAVFGYRVIYCMLVVVACVPNLIKTNAELDALTSLGTGVMLVVNIPLTLFFGKKAMQAYHAYVARLKDGSMEKPHAARPLAEMMEEDD